MSATPDDHCDSCGMRAYTRWELVDVNKSLMRQLDAERARVTRLRAYIAVVEPQALHTYGTYPDIPAHREMFGLHDGDLEATT